MEHNIRKLSEIDYEHGYLDILAQLTTVGTITKEMFSTFIDDLTDNHQVHVVHNNEGKVTGTGTLYIENKLIHSCGKVGHIEDIVIDNRYRGYGLGKKIVEHLKDIANDMGCYKIILDCNNSNVSFYEKCGFTKRENQMVIYL